MWRDTGGQECSGTIIEGQGNMALPTRPRQTGVDVFPPRVSGFYGLSFIAVSVAAPSAGATPPSGVGGSAAVYRIDVVASRMVMHTYTEGILSAFAPNYTFAFTAFRGYVTLIPGDLGSATFLMETQADSVRLVNEAGAAKRQDMERMLRDEILETGRFPLMVYRSTNITLREQGTRDYRGALEGTLTQHGVTRPCPMSVGVAFSGAGSDAEETLRLRGGFSILQTQYDMTLMTFAFGTVRVRDRVDITFDLVARRE